MRCVCIALGVFAVASAPASATTVNFDSYANGTALNTQYAGVGVTFSATTSAMISDIIAAGPGYATSSPRNIAIADWANNVQGTLRMDFAGSASAVSFYAIDVGESSRDAIAYDALNNVLQTITIHNPASGAGIGNINLVSFSASNIAYVTFGQGAVYAAGDGAGIDDVSFTIPGPSTAVLLGLGGAIATRRRR